MTTLFDLDYNIIVNAIVRIVLGAGAPFVLTNLLKLYTDTLISSTAPRQLRGEILSQYFYSYIQLCFCQTPSQMQYKY